MLVETDELKEKKNERQKIGLERIERVGDQAHWAL